MTNPSRTLGRAGTLLCLLALSSAAQQAAPAGVRIVRPGDLKWERIPGYPPDYRRAMLEGKMDSHAPITYRVRLPPHYRVNPHTHPSDEHVTILAGAWYVAVGTAFDETRMERLEVGSFAVIPAGVPHYVMTGDSETIVQAQGNGPASMTYVTPPARR